MRILYPANIRLPMERANSIQIVNTSHALARQGAQVTLVVRRMSGTSEREGLAFYGLEPSPNLRLIRLPVANTHWHERLWNASFYFSLVFSRLMLARGRKYDLVYTREPLTVRLFARTRGWHRARVVYELHELPAWVLERYAAQLSGAANSMGPLPKEAQHVRDTCQMSDGVVTLTHHMATALQQVLGVERPITVIPDGAVVGDTLPKVVPHEEPTICYTGQLYHWKGLKTLVEAMDYLEGKAKLVIVGGGPQHDPNDRAEMAELQRTIAASCRAADIVFTSFVEPSQVRRYQAESQVAVLSLSDGIVPRYCTSPLKLFEYMAAGKAMVAPRLPALEEILTDGQNALLVEPNDPQALAQAIDRLLADADLARRLGERAFQDARRYSWDERARAILAFVTPLPGVPS